MDRASYIKLGIIQRKQGLQGAIVVRFHQEIFRLNALKSLFIEIGHALVPYGIEYISLQQDRATIKLQGVNNATAAHDLKGCAVFVPQDVLPKVSSVPAQLTKLIEYQVIDEKGGDLGVLQDVYQPAQQYLLVVDYNGQELLIPYHQDIVTGVNHNQKSIQVKLPKGFIESAF